MKKSKIIIPALGILVLSTAASITGTVAWFSANTNVTVSGMSVTTKVSDNIYIAETNAEANFGAALTQGRTGIIEPSSTVNGLTYYWAVDGKANGASSSNTFTEYNESTASDNAARAGKSNYDSAFNSAYGTADGVGTLSYAYIDYSFFLKAVNTQSEAVRYVNLTTCNLLYNGAAVTEKAWRVGVFAATSARETNTADSAALTTGNTKSLLTLSGAANQESGKAVNSTSTKGAVTYNTAAHIGSITAGQTGYYKVVVRLWLEGEDTTCTTETFATLTSAYTLDLAFSIQNATGGVTNIGSSI